MLYTLTPDTTSSFKNIKVCKTRCSGDEDLKFNAAMSFYMYYGRVIMMQLIII